LNDDVAGNAISFLYSSNLKGYNYNFDYHQKLIISLRTAEAKDYSLDKEQTSYDDLLDALRLSLKGYMIE
jgi:hypothetical protein